MLPLLAACTVNTAGLAREPHDGQVRDDAGAGGADAGTDARGEPDAAGSCDWGYVPAYFDPCDRPAMVDMVLLAPGTHTYDTDRGELMDDEGEATMPPFGEHAGARVLWTAGFTVEAGAHLHVVGSLPLVVASEGDIVIDGTVHVSSYFDGADLQRGAGANPVACSVAPPSAGIACGEHGGSGGGGGGFGGGGGTGGRGRSETDCDFGDPGAPGGAGGAPLSAPPAMLRGGCTGADGAPSNRQDTGHGLGSPGGGAIQLAAMGALGVTGTVHAGGAGGGEATDNRSGGGGGGSGGMIGLEARELHIATTAFVAANGGGGGGGCDTRAATRGTDGSATLDAATGGLGENTGGDGGDGGHRDSPPGEDGDDGVRGGGGGGGGVGWILLRAHSLRDVNEGATFSPAYVEP